MAVSLGRPVPLASLDRPVPLPEPAWNPQAAPADAGWNTPTLPDAAPAWNAPTAGPASPAPPEPEVMPIGYDPAPGALLEPRVARGQPPDPAPPAALVGPPPAPPAADGAYNTGVAVDQPLHHPFLEGCARVVQLRLPAQQLLRRLVQERPLLRRQPDLARDQSVLLRGSARR